MRCVIIGGDAAGMSAASQIKRAHKDWEVLVLEKGEFTSYAACGIPYLFAGDVGNLDDLVVVSPEEFRNKRGIDVRTGHKATAIDPKNKTVTAESGQGSENFSYDKLLIATGAEAIVPKWPGVDLEGVVTLRNLSDAKALQKRLETLDVKKVVIIGGGYIGLEMAEAFGRRGLDITVIEKMDAVMGGAEETINAMVQKELLTHGVKLHLSTTVEGFSGQDGRIKEVLTDAGAFEADLALVSLGVRPRSRLAEKAGIALGARGAIAVNRRQETNVADIWAAGDCAESFNRVLEQPVFIPLALGANRQGRVAGNNMAGGDESFPGILGTAVTRVFDLAIARTGIDAQGAADAGIVVASTEATASNQAHYIKGHGKVWVKLFYRQDNLQLVGAWLCGHDPSLAKRNDIIATAISAKMTVLEFSDLDLSYAPPFAPVWDPVIQAANKARFALARNG